MTIRIHGARQNNLAGVDVSLPRGRLTVVTGVSGSGKSSLAFDTLYAEGQRRYVESFSTYARQFLERKDRPLVDRIDGLLPAVALEQKNTIRSSRSTLGTLTELTDYLKVLFARLATLHCPACGEAVTVDPPDVAADRLLEDHGGRRAMISFAFDAGTGEASELAQRFLVQQGWRRVLRAGKIASLDDPGTRPLRGREELLVDRFSLRADERPRLIEAFETAYRLGSGIAHADVEGARGAFERLTFHRDPTHCGERFEEPSEGLFSFNSPVGACEPCKGFGRVLDIDFDRVVPDPSRSIRAGAIEPWNVPVAQAERKALRAACSAAGISIDVPFSSLSAAERRFVLEGGTLGGNKFKGFRGWFKMMEQKTYRMHVRIFLSRYRAYVTCPECDGTRFKREVRRFVLHGKTLPDVLGMTVEEAGRWLAGLPAGARARALAPVTAQLATRLGYLEKVGLGYLTLDRQARTLSGGEVQRANLTTTLGSGLVNTLFVLDEPTVGLHADDAERLSAALSDLVARDNTVVVVEHDPDMLRVADHIIEMGPGPGAAGGRVLYAGPPAAFEGVPGSPTLEALAARARPRRLVKRRPEAGQQVLRIEGASAWNLKDVTVSFPVGRLSVVTGVSGSGKSTLIEDVLHRHVLRRQGQATDTPGAVRAITGLEHFSEVVWVDQSPPQASSRAIPVTYVGAWDWFRNAFARTPLAKARGYTASTFSFNTGNGRCPACEGAGFETVEMQFLADVRLVCEACEGTRFRREVLDVTWQGLSVSDVLNLTIDEALERMKAKTQAASQLEGLRAVGLGYLRLGQPLSTLSGGEAQRLKLAEHLMSTRKRVLFLLDEPTTGLHLKDVDRLIAVLGELTSTDRGHTVVCIEHHLDVVAAADHVVDLGPGGGDAGGRVVFEGPPDALVKADTATGRHLRRWLGGIAPLARTELVVRDATPEYDGEGWITVEGAKTHNLRGIDVRIPRSGRTVVSGVSGSGKSTLVFDIVFAEGQRRFLDCLSAYARQYIEQLARPDADRIEGIPPTVAIEQRTTRGGSRSNVANVTEIDPFLRILYARLGSLPGSGVAGGLTPSALAGHLKAHGTKGTFTVAAPIVQSRQGLHQNVFERAAAEGWETLVDGVVHAAGRTPRLRKRLHHDIDFIIGRASVRAADFVELVETAATLGKGQVRLVGDDGASRLFQIAGEDGDAEVARSSNGFDPRYFSYRTKLGRCEACEGWGADEEGSTCKVCDGERLGPIGRSVLFGGKTFPEVLRQNPEALLAWLRGLPLDKRAAAIAEGPIRAVSERVAFLVEVGLGYLGLDRSVRSLSGGEAQRIRLAAQLGAHLSGVLYVLDEPTIGLHPTDTEKLLATLDRLEARGNGILMVEHDETTLRTADMLIDIGPGAGVEGGRVLAAGPVHEVLKSKESITGRCLRDPRPRVRPEPRDLDDCEWISLSKVEHHTLEKVDVKLPRGRFVAVTGVSGSGKSSLVEVVTKAIMPERGGGAWKRVSGVAGLSTLIEIDDQPIGKNPRSTPATYVGVWDAIRTMYAGLPEAKVRGYKPGRFSFNVAGGRCEACAGNGLVTLEMSFLPEAWVPCTVCRGRRFSDQTLQVMWEGHSIHDVLNMPVRDALAVFERVPSIAQKLQLLDDVGLGYLTLGQPSPTLSGGEAQRIKLVTHLAGRGQPKTVIILDEPSIGLHMADVPKLVDVLHRLVDKGATVIVVEHNADIIREADWVIDMGPGPGAEGGQVVYAGPVAGLSEVEASRTGQWLAREAGHRGGNRKPGAKARATKRGRAKAG